MRETFKDGNRNRSHGDHLGQGVPKARFQKAEAEEREQIRQGEAVSLRKSPLDF